jgi:hypothetical protein
MGTMIDTQSDLFAWAQDLERENNRIAEINAQRARNRGYLVFATDPSHGVDSAEYQHVYATEARTPNQTIAKVRPLAAGRRLRAFLSTGKYRDEVATPAGWRRAAAIGLRLLDRAHSSSPEGSSLCIAIRDSAVRLVDYATGRWRSLRTRSQLRMRLGARKIQTRRDLSRGARCRSQCNSKISGTWLVGSANLHLRLRLPIARRKTVARKPDSLVACSRKLRNS